MFKQHLLIAGLLIGISACGSADQNTQGQASESSSTTTESGTDQVNVPAQAPASVQHIGQAKFDELKNGADVVVIDVRTAGEVAQGYIEGTDMFIDFYQNFEAGIAKLDKDKTYLMYCRSGARSANASNIMVSKGFTKVYNLQGGISRYNGTIVKD